jgi:hypothetical protein
MATGTSIIKYSTTLTRTRAVSADLNSHFEAEERNNLMSEEPHDGGSEERHLLQRTRVYVFVAIACVFLQGSVLSYAIDSNGLPRAWALWVAVFAFSATAFVYSVVRANKLSKRYRYLKWGEK